MPPADAPVPDDKALWGLAEVLGRELFARGLRLAVAESCTGGWIAKTLTDVPGSSEWFDAGLVTYSNAAKHDLLGVPAATLDEHGAVSEPVVREMVAGARQVTGADAAIAVSGIAGPHSDSTVKPVGLVHFAFSLADRAWASEARFAGNREAVRRQAVGFAISAMLDAVRQESG